MYQTDNILPVILQNNTVKQRVLIKFNVQKSGTDVRTTMTEKLMVQVTLKKVEIIFVSLKVKKKEELWNVRDNMKNAKVIRKNVIEKKDCVYKPSKIIE